jgi:hypothetical protein
MEPCYSSGMRILLMMPTAALLFAALGTFAAPLRAQQPLETSIVSRPNGQNVLLCRKVAPIPQDSARIIYSFAIESDQLSREFVIAFDSTARPRILEMYGVVQSASGGSMLQQVVATFHHADSVSVIAKYADSAWAVARPDVKPKLQALTLLPEHADSVRALARWAWEKRCSR